jgi:hypothetical protein
MKVAVEGLQRSKRDGTKVNLWFNPSKIKINELNLEDKKRLKVKKEKEENAPNKK